MSEELYPTAPVLLVDDELPWLRGMSLALARSLGVTHTVLCHDSRQVAELLRQQEFSLVLLDVTMPYLTGEELLGQLAEDFPELPVIMLTGRNQVEIAVRCMQRGAFDYFIKTMEEQRLMTGVRRALELSQLRRENRRLRDGFFQRQVRQPAAFAPLITSSSRLQDIFCYIEAIASSGEPVLITGASGTGKELIARAIHATSSPQGPWVAVNAAGLDDNVFADTLFGHARGAFTGAVEARAGVIEKAAGGVLFLDEIGDLSLASQVKLLRLLQEGEYYPLGSDQPRRVRLRLVFATNRDLGQLLAAGQFRQDLYYRLRAHQIQLPLLRERPEDLAPLLEHFLAEAASAMGKKQPTPPPELLTLLRTYAFPGNVRELRAMVYDAVSQHQSGKLSMALFKQAIGTAAEAPPPAGDSPPAAGLFSQVASLPTINAAVQELVAEAMARAEGNQAIASGLLGISRPALCKRLKKTD